MPNKFYELYKLTNCWLKKFPKPERYTLGERLENTILDIISSIYFLNQLPDTVKENHLLIALAKNETVKVLFRLANDIGILDVNKYTQAELILVETGKMLGGWTNYLRTKR